MAVPPSPQPWGTLKLHTWEPKSLHPLAAEQPKAVKLAGTSEFVVGRFSQAALRLNKALVWASNKHFVLRYDAQSGDVTVRDTSSNGTKSIFINSTR